MTSTYTTHVNPKWLDPAGYVAFLNHVFPGQWNRRSYDWYLRRPFNGAEGEILVRADGARIVCGMGMSHRQIRVGADRIVDVHVISAAATLKDEQGRGHYGALLQLALERAREKRSAALLGFVTRSNASGRGLLRLGSRAIPSFYVFSADPPRAAPAARPVRLESPPQVERMAQELARRPARVGSAHFHYARAEDLRQQFVQRPHPVRALRAAPDSLALVESVGSTDRLQWLTCPDGKVSSTIAALAARSAAASRGFFFYTLSPLQAAAARRVGLRVRNGYLMVQPSGCSRHDWETLAAATWSVQSGDRL
jgi:hypothetical protein